MKVQVKWGTQSFEVDVDATSDLATLQAQLFDLSNVPVDRQKILAKGKMLKTDADVQALTDGAKLMLMGTADPLPTGPKQAVVFEEDLTTEEKTKITGFSTAGLKNLGNTCYLNSTVQALRTIPDLKDALRALKSTTGTATTAPSTAASNPQDRATAVVFSDLFRLLDSASTAVNPLVFVNLFRTRFPQFDQRTPQGLHMQQDAEECLSQLLQLLADNVSAVPDHLRKFNPNAKNAIDALFGLDITYTVKPLETDAEPEITTVEAVRRLQCHIQGDTTLLHHALLASMKEEITKRSQVLGREARYLKTGAISRLPPFLCLQFVRFFWRNDIKAKTKVLKRVDFPMDLDIQPYVTPALSKAIGAKRAKQMDEESAKLGLTSAASAPTSASADADSKVQPMDVDVDHKVMLDMPHSGVYELQAVITHQGRNADGGHYIGWARIKDDDWMKYDDDTVSPCTGEDILKLSGGGDWHMAYILFYRLRLDSDPPKAKKKSK